MLPRLAVFFGVTTDELLDVDRHRIDEEVEALVTESVPLRQDPAQAEAFYRKELERYPNKPDLAKVASIRIGTLLAKYCKHSREWRRNA